MNIQSMYNDVIKYFENLNINQFINIKNEENNKNVETENKETNGEEGEKEENQENEQVTENNEISKGKNEQNQTEENIQRQTDENNQNQTQDTYQSENNDNIEEKNGVSEEQSNNNESGGVGGTDEEVNIQSNEQISQMELDANFVKNNFEMTIPVNGTITSRFGTRTPTDIISANHAGIDIGAYEGMKISAAMDGKVNLVSGVGDYGNHVKIENGNVSTLYAHCKKIYVKEGEEVKKGTEIAEVGSTGRATRTTFAF